MATASLDRWSPRHDSQKVDLAFVVDCTGSMGSYIQQAQRHVSNIADTVSRKAFDVRLALVEYRDHPPQDSSFVTKIHNFTSSVAEMKGWVDGMSASGGGDIPEAVADGLFAGLGLSYRREATKICVLIADAPPHGLNPQGDQIPDGCPFTYDPVSVCHRMAAQGIILYCVGCEPALAAYRDFFMGLSHITGGQYISLVRAQHLSQVIINCTREEVENENLMGYVDDYIDLEYQRNQVVPVNQLARSLHLVLRLNNNRTSRVQFGGHEMEEVSQLGRRISYCRTLSEVRELMGGNFSGVAQQQGVGETFDITALDEVTERQCERLVRRSLARNGRTPVENTCTDCEMDPA